MNIYAGIVTFNPDEKKLHSNVKAIISQVKTVIIYDNGSKNIKSIEKIAKENKLILLKGFKNYGIAYALNKLMEYGYKRQYKWMISLDQDSICPNNYAIVISDLIKKISKAGIIAPIIKDRNIGIIGHNPIGEYKDVNTCITSGACTNLLAWKSVNGFDEKMFIDSVDFDFCYRVKKAGFRVVQTSQLTLEHSLGDSKVISTLFGNKKVSMHSSFRYYYIAQNEIYYPKKNRLFFRFLRGNFRNIIHILNVVLYESQKSSKIKSILKGWYRGFQL